MDERFARELPAHCSQVRSLMNRVKGSAPLVMMKKKLGEELWREKEKIALGYQEEVLAGKQGELTSDAWLGIGVK